MMFDENSYKIITKHYDRDNPWREATAGPGYVLVKFIYRKDVPDCRGKLGNVISWADYVIGYEVKPRFGDHVFELFDVDMISPVVGEIKNWCDENLREYNMLVGVVIKSRIGMPRKFPIFEMWHEDDAMAFKLVWS